MDSKKVIEAVVLGGALVVSLQAYGAAACSAGAAQTVTSAGFVKAAFTPKCSANVTVDVNDATASFTVKSGSSKGKNYFGGSSEGGGVSACGTFATFAAPTASTAGC